MTGPTFAGSFDGGRAGGESGIRGGGGRGLRVGGVEEEDGTGVVMLVEEEEGEDIGMRGGRRSREYFLLRGEED